MGTWNHTLRQQTLEVLRQAEETVANCEQFDLERLGLIAFRLKLLASAAAEELIGDADLGDAAFSRGACGDADLINRLHELGADLELLGNLGLADAENAELAPPPVSGPSTGVGSAGR